ncbi:multidrug transporter [Rhodocyclus purpureus]|nr:multidrug transporter [Rhodocyclus purpureus]
MSPRIQRWLPAAALLLLTLAWGYTWTVAKQGLVYAPPFAFAAERVVGGALALFLVLKLMGRSLKLVAAGPTLAIGLAQVSGFMIFQTWALVEGGAGKTAVLIYTMPIWTLLLGWPILGERVRGKQWIAAASTLSGLVLIIEPWAMHASLFSEFLGLMGALFWAIGTILIKRLRSQTPVDLLNLTAWQMLFGALPLVVLALLAPERPTEWNLSFIGILAFMATVSTALCWLLWIYILDRVPAWEASLSVLGVPVVAILSSRLILGEEFRSAEVAGIVLVGGGLVLLSLLSWAASRRHPAAPRAG